MDLEEFRKELLEEVRSSAAADGAGTTAAFVESIASYLVDAEVLPDFEKAFYSGAGKKNRKIRIDGYAMDELDKTMNIAVANFVGNDRAETLTRTEAAQCFEWPIRFIDETYNNLLREKIEVSTPAYDLADTLLISRQKIHKYRIILMTDSSMSGRIEVLPIGDFEGIPVEYQIWNPDRIYKVCGVGSGRENIEIDFTQFISDGLPCLETFDNGSHHYRSFLAVIPGEALAEMYDHWGAQLLEGNVRSFLSTKVAVNKKIRETILKAPTMFFVFNNGIAATALSVTLNKNQKGTFIAAVSDFQIINGGQTTASLSNARYRDRADLSEIRVQLKLTEINAETDETASLIQTISRSSNSQNKVSDADFFSTHPFHVRMEQISRRLFAPSIGGAQYETHWFYERARGQYLQEQMRMTKTERNHFLTQNPKKQVIAKTDLAKVRNSWRRIPYIVSKGAQTNFSEFAAWVDNDWSSSDEAFNERYFQESVALFILFKHTEQLVSHEAWYQNAYRANIVTYSIALLAQLIDNQYPDRELDLQLIWNKQEVPDILTRQIKILTKAVYESITAPSRGVENVTQWCKREECWKRIKELSIEVAPQLDSVLEDRAEAKSAGRSARKDQKVVSGIEAQTVVVNYGVEYWKKLEGFSHLQRLATSHEIKALNVACKMPLKLPNSIQCQQLLALRERAIAEGWRD